MIKVIAYFDCCVENFFPDDICQHSQQSRPLRRKSKYIMSLTNIRDLNGSRSICKPLFFYGCVCFSVCVTFTLLYVMESNISVICIVVWTSSCGGLRGWEEARASCWNATWRSLTMYMSFWGKQTEARAGQRNQWQDGVSYVNAESQRITYYIKGRLHVVHCKVRHVGSEPFIQPKIIPPLHRHQISKPLSRK